WVALRQLVIEQGMEGADHRQLELAEIVALMETVVAEAGIGGVEGDGEIERLGRLEQGPEIAVGDVALALVGANENRAGAVRLGEFELGAHAVHGIEG